MTETDEKPAQRIERVAAGLGLTMTWSSIPWSQSRNKGEKKPSLNWTIHLAKKGKIFLSTDYGAGLGHCPSYKPSLSAHMSVDAFNTIRRECETGKAQTREMTRIAPSFPDVVSSLVLDSDALNYNTYEDWAASLGYEVDSRKGERIYRACLEIALKLRNALGEDGLKQLQEACQDY